MNIAIGGQHDIHTCKEAPAFEGDSHVEWFEGNFAAYVEDKRRRLGADADVPHRIKYKKLTR